MNFNQIKDVPRLNFKVRKYAFLMYILKHKLLERIQILVLPDGVLRGQEDCLMLNIFVPEHAFESSLPVMAWIHGGSLKHGSNRVKNLKVAESAFVFGLLYSLCKPNDRSRSSNLKSL